jgi:hypothetical protein
MKPKRARSRVTRKNAHRLNPLLHQVRVLKAEFDKAHADGMKAIEHHNFDAVTEAIARERAVIEKQYALFIAGNKTRPKPR